MVREINIVLCCCSFLTLLFETVVFLAHQGLEWSHNVSGIQKTAIDDVMMYLLQRLTSFVAKR